MEGAPGGVDVDQVRDAMRAVPGVRTVHDLHVWTITSGMVTLSGHVMVGDEDYTPAMLTRIREPLYERFGIDHITVQLECEGFAEPRMAI
jgi:cobalt-zinc-cadmium efflux system protein